MINQFVEQFKRINDTNGFYDFTPYLQDTGFSIKKDLSKSDSKNTSILSFYIRENSNQENDKKPILINAYYGERINSSVAIRNDSKIGAFDPVDLDSTEDYYYDVTNNKLLKGRRSISPIDLINEIYNDHIKPTKPIKGLWLRTKIFFSRTLLKNIFNYIAAFFHYLLYIITGDKYSYEPIMQEEILNNTILSHHWKEMIGRKKKPEMKDNFIQSAKFNFFENQVSYWIVIFYSILHLFLYIIFERKNWRPLIITTIFKNSFLTVIYVVVSLWILEVLVPKILKMLIKNFSKITAAISVKKIRI